MSDSLFSEFQEVSAKQWKQKIQFDLKGADYNDTLIWRSNTAIDVRPFYHQDDFKTPFLNPETQATQWKIGQYIFANDAQKANEKALDVLDRGAESICFHIASDNVNPVILTKDINLDSTRVYMNMDFLSDGYINQIISISRASQAGIFLNIDILGNLAKTGNWYYDNKTDHKKIKKVFELLSRPGDHSIKSLFSINLSLYQNSGASMVQQLAYSLAHANEYLNFIEANTEEKIVKFGSSFVFNVALGSNYFFEIAKLRALKILWKSLISEYSFQPECHILASPSKRNKTIYDYNVNLLRTTTECMSAVLGGANTICNLPYDSIYHKDNEFGERIARNQLLVLKNESYFDIVDNPADGSYYIENLTRQMAEKALILFKDIEAGGGFLNQLKEHTIQSKIRKSAQIEQEAFNDEKIVLIGTNKHPNPKDKMKDDLELYPFVKTDIRKTRLEPIIEKRLSEELEKERLDNEA